MDAAATRRLRLIEDLVTAFQLAAGTDEPAAVAAAAEAMDDAEVRDLINDLGTEQPELPLIDAARARVRQAAAIAAHSPFARLRAGLPAVASF